MNNIQATPKKINIHDPITIDKDDIEKRDILKRRHLAYRILNRLGEDDCPSVLGVYGGWGTGKTSLMNLLIDNNKQNNTNLHIEEIDAWKYESSDGLLIPIVVRLRKLAGDGDLPDVWRVIAKRALATTALSLADVVLKKFDIDRKQIKDTYDEVVLNDSKESFISVLKEWEEASDDIEDTNDAFQKIIGWAEKNLGGKRIVLCIDNLDRCSPENVVRLLESVKVFFNESRKCIWLFVMDSDIVASYINQKYNGTGIDGYSYLDKIIPEQYHLSLSPTTDGSLIASLLRYASGEDAQHQIDISKIPQIPKILVPRRLIKSAKKFSDYYKNGQVSQGVPPEIIMALSMLYHSWPDFYQRLSSASKEHIKGILENFFQKDPKKPVEARAKNVNIPMDEKFLQDKELVYFLQTVFAGYNSNSSERYVIDIVNGLGGLRKGGLP